MKFLPPLNKGEKSLIVDSSTKWVAVALALTSDSVPEPGFRVRAAAAALPEDFVPPCFTCCCHF